jgi:hypothetical protein
MQELVKRPAEVAGGLEITRDDIYNEFRRVATVRKAAASTCATVSSERYEESSVFYGEGSPSRRRYRRRPEPGQSSSGGCCHGLAGNGRSNLGVGFPRGHRDRQDVDGL